MKQKKEKKLTFQEEKFCQLLVLNGNGSEAKRQAYPKSANWNPDAVANAAYKMQQKPHIKARIKELQDEVKAKFDITAERILLEQARLAYFDQRNLYDDNGKPIAVHKLPEHVSAAISTVKYGKNEKGEQEIVEVKFWNKNQALDSLMKHRGLYSEDNKQKNVERMSDEELKAMALELSAKIQKLQKD